jgi:16S rRNA (adenine1518-N6/adenine1519-N6)-dimethyltransferase
VKRPPDTPSTVKAALAALGLAPLKRFGQNFLVDPRVLDRVAATSEAGPGDVVVEVGPGLGGLTARLHDRGVELIAVEIDHGLARHVRESFSGEPRFRLLERDVLDGGRTLAPELTAAVAERRAALGPATTWRVAANLPYGVTSPFLLSLLDPACGPPCRTTVMIQSEVGDVLVARPGSDAYSVLSLAAAIYWRASRLFDVGPEAFFPRPDVDSCVAALVPRGGPTPPPGPFLDFARTLFQSRRKALRSSLRRACPEVAAEAADEALRAAGLAATDRVDGVDPERIAALFSALGRA